MAITSRTEQQKQLDTISADDIKEEYSRGRITAKERNDLLRMKSHAELSSFVESNGLWMSILKKTVEHTQEGWNTYKESYVRKDPSIKGAAEDAARNVWGRIQMLSSIFTAVGEVSGQVAENMALKAGASPGLARAVFHIVDVGSGFLPVGYVYKGVGKVVQEVGKAAGAEKAVKTAKAIDAARVAKLADDQAQAVIDNALFDGLKVDGVTKGSGEVAGPFTVAEQFAQALKNTQKELKGVTESQAHEITMREAKKLGLGPDDLENLVPGAAVNEKIMAAHLMTLRPMTEQLGKLADDVLSGVPGADEQLQKYAIEYMRFAPKFRGAEVTAGRSVEILKEPDPMKAITDMLMEFDPEKMAKGDTAGAMQSFAENISDLIKTQGEAAASKLQLTMSQVPNKDPGFWKKARALWLNMLLATPSTHTKNAAGSAIASALETGDRFASGVLSLDKKTGVAMQEGWAQAKGITMAIGEGLRVAARSYSQDPAKLGAKLDYEPIRFKNWFGRGLQMIGGDTIRATDEFMKHIMMAGSMNAQALRSAAHKGLEGEAFKLHVARKLENPTIAMVEEAEDFALRNTFQSELGTLGKMAQKLQTGPLVLYFPFMKAPINLVKYAWDRTPGLQLISRKLYSDIVQGGTTADMAVGKLTMSYLQAQYVFNLAQEGLITGSGPQEPGLKSTWSERNSPYSAKTTDGNYIPYTNFEPASTVIGMVADVAQVYNQVDDPTKEQMGMAVAFSLMDLMVDKTYWKTFSDVTEITRKIAYQEPGAARDITKTLASPLVTVASGGPLVGRLTRALDPNLRESRSVVDNFISKVPGYSKTLPPKRGAYGDPIIPPQTIGGNWLGFAIPVKEKVVSDDWLSKEGASLGVKVRAFPWSVGGALRDDFDISQPFPEDKMPTGLTPQQRDRWQAIYRNINRDPELGIEAQLRSNPDYMEAPRAAKRDLLQKTLSANFNLAKESLLVEDKELNKLKLTNDTTAMLPFASDQQQEDLKTDLNDGLSLIDELSDQELENLHSYGFMGNEPRSPDQVYEGQEVLPNH